MGNGLGVTPALGISGESCSGLWEMKLPFLTLSCKVRILLVSTAQSGCVNQAKIKHTQYLAIIFSLSGYRNIFPFPNTLRCWITYNNNNKIK